MSCLGPIYLTPGPQDVAAVVGAGCISHCERSFSCAFSCGRGAHEGREDQAIAYDNGGRIPVQFL